MNCVYFFFTLNLQVSVSNQQLLKWVSPKFKHASESQHLSNLVQHVSFLAAQILGSLRIAFSLISLLSSGLVISVCYALKEDGMSSQQ